MLTIDSLKNVRRQRLRVVSLQERIAALRSRAEFTSRQLGECGTDDATRDRLAEYVAELDDLEHHLTSEMINLEHEVQSVDAGLTALPENQETILRQRYCEGKSWRKVAESAGYSISHCRNVHSSYQKDSTQKYIST